MRLGIEAGAEERFTKMVTERDLLLTAEITGDHDPLHVDEAYAARTAYGQRIAHGALVLGLLSSTASRIAPSRRGRRGCLSRWAMTACASWRRSSWGMG